MKFNESVEYIHSLLAFGIKPGLERISMLLDMLDNPQDKLKIVHIAGTNGKGSTSTMIADMLIADGHKTGLFTSPYVIDFCERIQIDGKNVSKDLFAECVTRVREKIDELNKKDIIITEFEAITVSAFLCFVMAGCEYVVLEVGLGGRFDATNVVKKPEAVVITSISLDHIAILGDTIEKIAFEKCGIIKENVPVITSSNQTKEALDVITRTTTQKQCELIITNPNECTLVSDTIREVFFSYKGQEYITHLSGNHQVENTVNAIECANVLGISNNSIKQGIFNTRMIARMEIINNKPLVIRDGGHNEGCAEALRSFLVKYNVKNINMLIGLMADKDVEGYVKKIAPLCKSVITTTPGNARALNGEGLKKITETYCENTKFIDNPKEGYQYILSNIKEDETVLICGSFYMMSDIFGE